MIRIGFVDHRLGNFHANVFLQAFRGTLASRSTVAGCFALDANDGRAWAEKNGVKWCDSVATMNDRVDAFMILAPSNPELHWQLCEMALPLGKATYVDKTFAPDLATAERIFALADQHQTPVQTTSALRYTAAQALVRQQPPGAVKHMIAWGGGSSFGEYAIHPVELLVSCMGSEATSLLRRGMSDYSQLLINFTGNRTGVANVYTAGDTPFAASVTTDKTTTLLTLDLDKIFLDTAAAVLDLFETGKPNVDRRESLMVRRILDAAENPAALQNFVSLE